MNRTLAAIVATLLSGCVWDWDRFANTAAPDGRRDLQRSDLRLEAAPPTDSRGERRDAVADTPPDSTSKLCSFSGSGWSFAVQPLAGLSSGEDDVEPFLTRDGLTIYFTRVPDVKSKLTFRVFRASRASAGVEFEASTVQGHTQVNPAGTPGLVGRFAITGDGLTAFLIAASSYPGTGTLDTFVTWWATRPDTSVGFTFARLNPQGLISKSDTDHHEWDVSPRADGLELCLVEHIPSTSTSRILCATRPSLSSPFGSFAQLKDTSGGTIVGDNASIGAGGRVLVFASGGDLYYATRPTPSGAFAVPQKLPAVNTVSRETESFLTEDGCELYFASDRGGGSLDLYRARFTQ